MRTTIKSRKGFVLTDGETYGREILLAEGRSAADFHEITEEEFKKVFEEEAEQCQ